MAINNGTNLGLAGLGRRENKQRGQEWENFFLSLGQWVNKSPLTVNDALWTKKSNRYGQSIQGLRGNFHMHQLISSCTHESTVLLLIRVKGQVVTLMTLPGHDLGHD